MGGKTPAYDLATEVTALTGWRAEVFDALAWLSIWFALVAVAVVVGN